MTLFSCHWPLDSGSGPSIEVPTCKGLTVLDAGTIIREHGVLGSPRAPNISAPLRRRSRFVRGMLTWTSTFINIKEGINKTEFRDVSILKFWPMLIRKCMFSSFGQYYYVGI